MEKSTCLFSQAMVEERANLIYKKRMDDAAKNNTEEPDYADCMEDACELVIDEGIQEQAGCDNYPMEEQVSIQHEPSKITFYPTSEQLDRVMMDEEYFNCDYMGVACECCHGESTCFAEPFHILPFGYEEHTSINADWELPF